MKSYILHTEGLMCRNCEAKAEGALLAVEGVIDAEADHESNTVQVSCEDAVDSNALAAAVEEEGYKVLSADEA